MSLATPTSKMRFAPLDAQLQAWVDAGLLPGVAVGVLRHGDLIHQACVGHAEIASATPLRPDHIHRAFSSTKLVTACAALLLWEQGKFGLDWLAPGHGFLIE